MNEGSAAPDFGAGPQWAIFDSEAVKREKWVIDGTTVHPDYFFSAPTLAELAAKIEACPYSKVKMPAANLEATVAEYNKYVELGVDEAFDKPKPQFKIEAGPFYAAWATITVHDTYAGLRINMKARSWTWTAKSSPVSTAAANPRQDAASTVWPAALPRAISQESKRPKNRSDDSPALTDE